MKTAEVTKELGAAGGDLKRAVEMDEKVLKGLRVTEKWKDNGEGRSRCMEERARMEEEEAMDGVR